MYTAFLNNLVFGIGEVKGSGSIRDTEFLIYLSDYQLLKTDFLWNKYVCVLTCFESEVPII
jgi:hypothetical protein